MLKKPYVFLLLGMLIIISSTYPLSATIASITQQPLPNGTIFYVGGSGPGNYTTIQEAVDAASNGDSVFVFDDLAPYTENITISKTLTLEGENKLTTIIDGSHGWGSSFHITADNVTITKFTIQNTGTGVYIGGVRETASYNQITDNIILNAHAGIAIYYGVPTAPDFLPYGHNTISYNYIKNTTYYGIMVNQGEHNHITHNTVIENHGAPDKNYSGFGIQISGAFNNISYNTISYNDGLGICIGDTYKTSIYRNTIDHNGMYGLGIACGSFDHIIQNNFIDNHRHAFYDQELFILTLSHKGHYPILPCIWKQNYWDKPRTLPYIIRGFIGYTGLICWSFYAKYDIIPTNFIRFDLHPAQEPYDIPETR